MSCCIKIEETPRRLTVCNLETIMMPYTICQIFSVYMNGREMEKYSLFGCNAVYFGESPAFRTNRPFPSPGSKSKPGKKPVEAGGSSSRFCA
jgi:hypothetical protein